MILLLLLKRHQPKAMKQGIGVQSRTKGIILPADIIKHPVAGPVVQMMERLVNYVVGKNLVWPYLAHAEKWNKPSTELRSLNKVYWKMI